MKFLRYFSDAGLLIRLNAAALSDELVAERNKFHEERETGLLTDANRRTAAEIISKGRLPWQGKLLSVLYTYSMAYLVIGFVIMLLLPNRPSTRLIFLLGVVAPTMIVGFWASVVLSVSPQKQNPPD